LAAQAHPGPADLEEIKIISPKKLKEVQKGALLAAMRRRLYKERSSPYCTILMGQRLRDRECEFVSNFKYGTVKSAKPLIRIGQCCSWVVNNYPSEQIKGYLVKAEAIYRYLRMIS